MYAVFEDGSRQYRVSEGDVVCVDYREVPEESRIEFDRVLLYQGATETLIGQPIIEGARVIGEVQEHPTTKQYIQKFRRRKNYRRFRGHRQPFTQVEIRNILLAGQEPPAGEPPAGAETPTAPTSETPTSETPSGA